MSATLSHTARARSKAPVPIAKNPVQYLTAAQVKARYGGIGEMTLWRWIGDPELGFPKPKIINRIRFFAEHELDAFDARQPVAGEM